MAMTGVLAGNSFLKFFKRIVFWIKVGKISNKRRIKYPTLDAKN